MSRIPTILATALFASCVLADDWPMQGGRPDRNMVSSEKGLPVTWQNSPKNIKWVVEIGTNNGASTVISGGRVFVGTNNEKPRDPGVKGDQGVLMCFSEADGKFLWQAVHEKLPQDLHQDEPKWGVCSTPSVAGDRVYYANNRGELVCCDVLGFSDKENDGPYKNEKRTGERDADIVWLLDVRKELGVSSNQAFASSTLVVGDLVFVVTGNGADYKAHKVLNPQAPSFIAVDRATGKVKWQDGSPGENVLTGQWGSPAYGVVDGQPQVVFPGGDGWLYAFEPAAGKLLWKFNCKAHEKNGPDGKPESEAQLIATPVFAGHRVLMALGVEPDNGHNADPGALRAIDARKRGDITATGELWKYAGDRVYGVSISTVAVHDGLVYAPDLDGRLNCLDLEKGTVVWQHDLVSTVWGSPLVADGKLYVQTGDGEVIVLQAGREKKQLAKNNALPRLFHGTVVAANGVLYVTAESKLYALTADK